MLIVDDEEMTRQGLVRLLAGSQLGLEVVGEADDGATALPLLEKLRPDILFTDVKMARMDGLALAKQARERYPDLEIVFLSGYSEVDYVRSAMRVGAFDYILKPVNFEELEQCFRRVIQRLEEKRRSRENMQKLQDFLLFARVFPTGSFPFISLSSSSASRKDKIGSRKIFFH